VRKDRLSGTCTDRYKDIYKDIMPDRLPVTGTSTVEIADLAALDGLAARLAKPARAGDAFTLTGELGAGKTTFSRAFIAALAKRENVAPPLDVPSPTFTLMQSYDIGSLQVFHFDLYRLKNAEETLELGIEDTAYEGIALIEWPERLGPYMPRNRLDIDLAITGEGSRRATLQAHGSMAQRYKEMRYKENP
jgi:tRNA threonylcarbamoyladenosine biosynthesis protein TsaE